MICRGLEACYFYTTPLAKRFKDATGQKSVGVWDFMINNRHEIAINETVELLISLRATDYENLFVSILLGSIQSFVHGQH